MALRSILPDALQVLRQVQDLSVEELAERSGVKKQQIQRYEAGESYPPPESLEALLAALGVRLSALFALVEVLDGALEGQSARQMQQPLFSELREADEVDRVFFLTAAGQLQEVDDPYAGWELRTALEKAGAVAHVVGSLRPQDPVLEGERQERRRRRIRRLRASPSKGSPAAPGDPPAQAAARRAEAPPDPER